MRITVATVVTVVLVASLQGPTAQAGGFGSGGFGSPAGSYASQQAARMQQQRLQQLEQRQRQIRAVSWSSANSANAAEREYRERAERLTREMRDRDFTSRTASQQLRERRVMRWPEKTRLAFRTATTGARPAVAPGSFGAFVQRPVREIRTDFGGRPAAPAGTLMAAARAARNEAPRAGMARRGHDLRPPRGHRRPERTHGLSSSPDRRPRLTVLATRTPPRFQPLHVRTRAGAAHVPAPRSVRPALTVKRPLPFHPPRFKLVTGKRQ